MPGDTHVDEAERALDISLPEGEYETLAGMVIAARGGFPEVGETVWITLPVDADDLLENAKAVPRRIAIETLEIERHVPDLIRIVIPDPDDDEEPSWA
jgi:CBS domain containing-hemolysin-like protein